MIKREFKGSEGDLGEKGASGSITVYSRFRNVKSVSINREVTVGEHRSGHELHCSNDDPQRPQKKNKCTI